MPLIAVPVILITSGVTAAAEWSNIFGLLVAVLGLLASGAGIAGWRRQQRRSQAVRLAEAGTLGARAATGRRTVFVGRADELERLAAVVRDQRRAPATVIAIHGMAGAGKAALAVHAAHPLARHQAGEFPDRQLFIDLHGHSSKATPVGAGEALDRMLRTLSVPDHRLPVEVDDRAAQVTPLLPGRPGCLVLVTSRRRLAGVNATLTLSLAALPLDEATALLAHAAEDPSLLTVSRELVVQAVEHCARLPLAIHIAGVLLTTRFGLRVAPCRGIRQPGEMTADRTGAASRGRRAGYGRRPARSSGR